MQSTAIIPVLCLLNLALCAEPTPAPRRYEAGPLTSADFAASPPADRRDLMASTHTALEYTVQYRGTTSAQGTRVFATKLEVYATLTPAKSWNAAPADARLLDHEQGHFDITQLHARKWRQQAAAQIARQALAGQGRTEAAARQALQERIETEQRTINKAWEAEQILYDKETDHGRRPDVQARWRERLNLELSAKGSSVR